MRQDCVYSLQKGPSLHAFCGGLLKLEDGSWINGSPVTDFVSNGQLVLDLVTRSARFQLASIEAFNS